MTTTPRVRVLLAAIPLALMLGLAGCSDDGGDTNGVASASGDSADSDGGGNGSSGPLSDDEAYEQMLDYAQCLRDHGVDVEDPAPGEGIQLQIDGGPHQADAALQACQHLAPPPPAAAEDEAERQDMLDYAQCMRDNGVEKFADPKPGEGINIEPLIVEDPDYEAAKQTCGEIFGGGPDEGEQQQRDFSGSTA